MEGGINRGPNSGRVTDTRVTDTGEPPCQIE
jgi:hypothetical protein